MGNSKESLERNEPKHPEIINADIEMDPSEALAHKIIREAAKLSRPLDLYDAPMLARLIKDFKLSSDSNSRTQ
jgi:hypothetical protein